MSIDLTKDELRKLLKLHRRLKNKGDAKSADRIKTIISLAKGYSYSEVAEILLLDETTIREYAKKYEKGGIDELLAYYYKPYEGFLFDYEIEILCEELDSKIYLDAKAVCAFILEAFLLMGAFAYLLSKWGVSQLHWGWFIGLSLLGSMAFALPVVLLWPKKINRAE